MHIHLFPLLQSPRFIAIFITLPSSYSNGTIPDPFAFFYKMLLLHRHFGAFFTSSSVASSVNNLSASKRSIDLIFIKLTIVIYSSNENALGLCSHFLCCYGTNVHVQEFGGSTDRRIHSYEVIILLLTFVFQKHLIWISHRYTSSSLSPCITLSVGLPS